MERKKRLFVKGSPLRDKDCNTNQSIDKQVPSPLSDDSGEDEILEDDEQQVTKQKKQLDYNQVERQDQKGDSDEEEEEEDLLGEVIVQQSSSCNQSIIKKMQSVIMNRGKLDSSTGISDLTEQNYMAVKNTMMKQGYIATPSDDGHTIRKFVNEKLWLHVKFITCKEQLDCLEDQSIMTWVTTRLHITDESKYNWWTLHKKQVHQNLRHKRNNVTTAMRKVFVGKYLENEM